MGLAAHGARARAAGPRCVAGSGRGRPSIGTASCRDPVREHPAQVVNDAGVGESYAQHLVRQLLEDERLALERRAVGVQWQIRTTSSPISRTSFESLGSGIGASIVSLAASVTSRSRAPESTSHISDRPADLPMKKGERALTISGAQRVGTAANGA